MIFLRLILLAGINPPDMMTFFWNNCAASGRNDDRLGQFCAILLADKVVYLQTVYRDCTRLHKGIGRSQGCIFLLNEKVRPYYRNT